VTENPSFEKLIAELLKLQHTLEWTQKTANVNYEACRRAQDESDQLRAELAKARAEYEHHIQINAGLRLEISQLNGVRAWLKEHAALTLKEEPVR
jgi:hypothetical protein